MFSPYVQDSKLVQVLQIYGRHGRQTLLLETAEEEEPEQMFLTKHGKPFKDTSICRWFKKEISQPQGFSQSFTMQNLRHIMITAFRRLKGNQVAAEGAAFCMGNSLHTWDRNYDVLERGERMVQQGQQGVQMLRKSLKLKRGRHHQVVEESEEEEEE